MSLRTTIFGSRYWFITTITDLNISGIYGTAFQLSFTVPLSSHTISYYEVYLNGVYWGNIQKPGDFVVHIQQQTTYSVTIVPVDINEKKGNQSNTATETTVIPVVPTTGLLSYYKLDELTKPNAVDSYGTLNGTHSPNAVLGDPGKKGTLVRHIRGSSWTDLMNNNTLSPSRTSPFSVCLWAKINQLESATYINRAFTFKKTKTTSAIILGFDKTNRAFVFINGTAFRSAVGSVTANTLFHLGVTFDGQKFTGYFQGTKIFEHNDVMPILEPTPVQIGYYNQTSLEPIGINGSVDELPIYQKALNPGEMSDFFNHSNGITL